MRFDLFPLSVYFRPWDRGRIFPINVVRILSLFRDTRALLTDVGAMTASKHPELMSFNGSRLRLEQMARVSFETGILSASTSTPR